MELSKRKQMRLKGYDYSSCGAYFITVSTYKKQPILCDICRGGALLRPIGEICKAQIVALEKRYTIKIDHHVVMPNHIHIILLIDRAEMPICRAEQSPAPTVSDIICALKSIATKLANINDNTAGRKIWQRSFHDHIIRNEQEYAQIWQYIEENPLKWEEDCFYV